MSAETGHSEFTAVLVVLFVDVGGIDAVTFNVKIKYDKCFAIVTTKTV